MSFHATLEEDGNANMVAESKIAKITGKCERGKYFEPLSHHRSICNGTLQRRASKLPCKSQSIQVVTYRGLAKREY
ncbi:hypothetical protein KM043_007612 [Ampulex compressa]|nr:hypothetical protein KM043_007612 [Ampulex compressa]